MITWALFVAAVAALTARRLHVDLAPKPKHRAGR
jgi:hypothetical protein